jgi:methylenetetrahydrofolate reductase (NADPH)
MHIRDIFAASSPTISFEFFPANSSEGRDRLQDTLQRLALAQPSFVSVTYGAGGSMRHATRDLVEHLKRQTTFDPIPHLTCVNQRPDDIDAILESYALEGVSNILALRGDKPRDAPHHNHAADAFPQGADLVRHVRRFNDRGFHADQRGFGIGVAGFPEGHPATPNRLLEMDHLKAKVDAGADYICTQLFFDNHNFDDFRERCEWAGIQVPILAGLLPVTSMSGLRRMAELAGGVRIPAKLLKGLSQVEGDPAAVLEVGLAHATEQCEGLLSRGVGGIHFYTLNQSAPVLEILRRLGLVSRSVPPVFEPFDRSTGMRSNKAQAVLPHPSPTGPRSP